MKTRQTNVDVGNQHDNQDQENKVATIGGEY